MNDIRDSKGRFLNHHGDIKPDFSPKLDYTKVLNKMMTRRQKENDKNK